MAAPYRTVTHPDLKMDTSFSIEFSRTSTDDLFGVFVITMKEVKMTTEVLMELIAMLQTRFHFILSHSQQEGELEEEMFCETAYQQIIHTKDQIANFFGEDATVTLDRNVEFYRDACMDMIYRASLQLTFGAPIMNGEEDRHWEYSSVSESTMERVMNLLSGAEVM